MAILFSGPFDEVALSAILELGSEEREDFLNKFKGCSLILPANSIGGKDMYEVTPLIRETARKMYKDPVSQENYGIGPRAMSETWASYVSFFKDVATEDFKDTRTAPQTSYNILLRNRPNIQQALRLVLSEPKIIKSNPVLLNDILEIL